MPSGRREQGDVRAMNCTVCTLNPARIAMHEEGYNTDTTARLEQLERDIVAVALENNKSISPHKVTLHQYSCNRY